MGILVPHLHGGLGNWLFQISAALYVGEYRSIVIAPNHCSLSPHSSKDYFSTILKNFNIRKIDKELTCIVEAQKLNFHESDILNIKIFLLTKNVLMHGYYHKHIHATKKFKDMLYFENKDKLLAKYPTIRDSCFIHVRGGDYVNHSLHYVGLENNYYPAALNFMVSRGINKFVVFTNDKNYCLSLTVFKNIEYSIIEESEIDTLYLMSQCKAAIIPNSTFSWWGAVLNTERPICIPSKWFNDMEYDISGYFFPGAIIITV